MIDELSSTLLITILNRVANEEKTKVVNFREVFLVSLVRPAGSTKEITNLAAVKEAIGKCFNDHEFPEEVILMEDV